MSRLGERLAQWDDRSNVFRSPESLKSVKWTRLVVISAIAGVITAAVLSVVAQIAGGGAVLPILLGALILMLAAYIVWRRRRNRALTGSPRTWPST